MTLLQQRLQGSDPSGAGSEPVDEPALRREVRDAVLRERGRDLEDRGPTARARIAAFVQSLVQERARGVPLLRRNQLTAELLHDLLGFGPIQPLIDDPTVTEICVNRWDRVYAERHAVLELTDIRFPDGDGQIRTLIEKIVGPLGRRIDESSPMVDARLPDGSRVNAIIPPLALDGPCLTIRKFARQLALEDLLASGTLAQAAAEFLRCCVEARRAILVSGNTGSGKTSLLNILSGFIPPHERIVTIEDAAELRLLQPHVVRLEARPPNIEGAGEVTIRQLVRNALRMRPDRIIVGEVRSAEALDMLQALLTGHDGGLTTVHAPSPQAALRRLETMASMAEENLPLRAIREQIADAFSVVVQLRREGRSRQVVEISELSGGVGDGVVLTPLWVRDPESGRLEEVARCSS